MIYRMEESEILIGTTPPEFMLFPIVGALVVIGCTIWHVIRSREEGERLGVGSIVWSVLITAILIFMAVWCNMQLVEAEELFWIQSVVILTATGAILTRREKVFRALVSLDEAGPAQRTASQILRTVRDVALILIGSEMSRRALEIPWNTKIEEIAPSHVAIELTLITIVAFIAYFLCQRRAAGPAIVFTVCIGLGIVEHFIFEFRRAAILPMDILALGTAAEVGNQYTYLLYTDDIRALIYGGLALLCASFIRPSQSTGLKRFVTDLCWNLPLALVFALALSWWIAVPNYREDFGLDISYWNTEKSYKAQGFLPSFMTALNDLPIAVPENYDEERAEEVTKAYAAMADDLPGRRERRAESTKQFAQIQPSIVIVMNETFADLSRLNKLQCDYEGPQFFQHGLDDALMRGQLGMSVYGAGTCNSEFECLTGNSLAFVGTGKYPYQMFTFEEVPNLARQLSEIGYTTSAIHPNDKDNWNRRVTYEAMGFDEFYNTNNSFADAPSFHSGITDKATYEKIIEVLNSSNDPQFVFDVTMQNHGGYSTNNIPPERMTNYVFPGIDAEYTHQLNEYLSCIQASDEDLEWFIGQLRKLDRPVVLAFFGDHHPSCANVANDAYFPGEEELQHQARVYQTEYFVWANYDVAGTSQEGNVDNCGTDMLGTRTLDLAGAPLEDFQSAQLAVHQRLQIISGIGYQGTDGRWHIPGTEPYLDTTYRDMSLMDFLRFGSKFVDEEEIEAATAKDAAEAA